MKYKIYQKVVVNQPCHETTEFDTLDECAAWLKQQPTPINYIVVDVETNEWFDGYALTLPADYQKLFSYRT